MTSIKWNSSKNHSYNFFIATLVMYNTQLFINYIYVMKLLCCSSQKRKKINKCQN